MKKKTVSIIVAALLLFTIGGCLVFRTGREERTPTNDAVSREAGPPAEFRPRMASAGKAVGEAPKNHSAWVQLGNDYFDSGQPAKAVDAYGKALELSPDDPDVLIDQGNCYRKIGRYDMALANFERVLKLHPNHEQGLVNMGILCAIDLDRPDKALQAWSRFLELNPASPASGQVRHWVEQLRAKGDLKSCEEQ